MSAATDPSSTRTWRAPWWVLGAVAVVVVLVVAVPDGAAPYATTSTDGDGTDILRRVLADLGTEMVQGSAGDVLGSLDPGDTAVVFRDTLTERQEADLRDHVEAGGRLVVGDPGSGLAGGLGVVRGEGVSGGPRCDLVPGRTRLQLDQGVLPTGEVVAVPDLVRLGVDPSAACWERDGAALVATWDGALDGPPARVAGSGGTTVVLGDADVVTNAAIIADPDLGQLAALFLPPDDAGRVVVVTGPQAPPVPGTQAGVPGADVASADAGVVGALPDRFRQGLWLVALAAVLYGLARARRHGRVLTEPPPVEVPASALAGSIAELLERHGEAADAAARVRDQLRVDLAPRLGTGVGGSWHGAGDTGDRDAEDLVPLAARASGLDPELVAVAMANRPVRGVDDLVAVVAAGRRLRAALQPGGEAPTRPHGASDDRGGGRHGGHRREGDARDPDDHDRSTTTGGHHGR